MRSIKQLFCSHILKKVDEEFLERKRMRLTDYAYANYDYYAVHKECIKCGYTKITWKRYILI